MCSRSWFAVNQARSTKVTNGCVHRNNVFKVVLRERLSGIYKVFAHEMRIGMYSRSCFASDLARPAEFLQFKMRTAIVR